jgi:NADP-dependent 3-hydroxy acid dehydrogenase YdfG
MGTSGVAGKVAVITGASSGIGESTAKLLAREGARVVLGARRKERIDALAEEITDAGGKAVTVVADVSRRSDVNDLVKRALDAFERVDVLVNNAGIMPIAPVQALKVDEWDRVIDVNVKGLLYGVAAVLPTMQRQRSGHIVNIASVGGIKAFAPGGAVYSATKAAVRMLTEGLRMELHSQNIRCTAISPGAVATELPEGSSDEATRKNLREFYKMAIPAGTIASAIAYAIAQPPEVEIDEMVIRPTAQDF